MQRFVVVVKRFQIITKLLVEAGNVAQRLSFANTITQPLRDFQALTKQGQRLFCVTRCLVNAPHAAQHAANSYLVFNLAGKLERFLVISNRPLFITTPAKGIGQMVLGGRFHMLVLQRLGQRQLLLVNGDSLRQIAHVAVAGTQVAQRSRFFCLGTGLPGNGQLFLVEINGPAPVA